MAVNGSKKNKNDYNLSDLISEVNGNEGLQDIINTAKSNNNVNKSYNSNNKRENKNNSKNASSKKKTTANNNTSTKKNTVKNDKIVSSTKSKNNTSNYNKKVSSKKESINLTKNLPKKNENEVTIKELKINFSKEDNDEENASNDSYREPKIIPLEDTIVFKNKIEDDVIVSEEDTEVIDNAENEIHEDKFENEIIEDNDEDVDKLTVNNDNKKTNKLKIIMYILIPILFLVAIIYAIIPKIWLKGDRNVSINYDQKYVEKGYTANILFKDISDKVKVKNDVIDYKVGSYKITYYLDYKFIKFKRTRKVNIVDTRPPVINVDNDVKICPNASIQDIPYTIIDGYDGDISNKAKLDYNNDKLTITVSDSSSNETVKEVLVNKIDDEKPVITLKGSDTIYLTPNGKFYEPGYTAMDNCDGEITDKVVTSGTIGSSVGTYKLSYSVTDSSNNTTTVERTVIVRTSLYNSGTIGNGVIYLTFDDGPSWGTTNVILDILKDEGVKATFFVTCNGPDELIKRMYNEGHTVALHTATHNYSYIYSSVDNYFEDLNRVGTRVKNLTGYDSKIIRFPGGSSNTVSRQYKYGIMTQLTSMVLDKGYRYYDWNIDSNDAGGARSSSEVYNNVTRNLSKYRSNVVLMHDIKTTTRDAIRNIIIYGKTNGYSFDKITMDTYMIRHGVNN